MMIRIFKLSCLLFSFCISELEGQTYNFRKFSEENGLRQGFIYCISQGADRQLYCSTGEGLCTFDGFNFRTTSSKDLADNFVTTHLIDSRNTIWLGHNQNGVSVISHGKIRHLSHPLLINFKVTQLAETTTGGVIIATAGGGLFFADTIFQVSALEDSPEFLNGISAGGHDTLFAATPDGLKILTFDKERTSCKVASGLYTGENIRQVIFDRERATVLALTEESIIYRVKKNRNGMNETGIIRLSMPSENFVSCIFSDRDGSLWLGTFGEGVRRVTFGDPVNRDFETVIYETSNGFPSRHVQSIYQDIEGDMWFGTLSDGLIQKPAEKFAFYGAGERLITPNIECVVKVGDKLWVAGKSGLSVYSPEEKNSRKIERPHFTGRELTSLYRSADGLLWVGTREHGVVVVDTTNFAISGISATDDLNRSSVNHIAASGSRIAVATTDGLFLFEPSRSELHSYTTNEGLLHNNVIFTFTDSDDRLWIASHGAPPYYIKDGKAISFKAIKGLASFRINSYSEDNSKNIWIATDGDGVFKFSNGVFTQYRKSDGLLSDYCAGVMCSADNAVWVTHRSGLSEKKNGNAWFNNYTVQKGLLFAENNLNSFSRNGNELWFGTTLGLVSYNSDAAATHDVRPEVRITSVSFNKREFDPNQNMDQPYGYYSVNIGFIAVSLAEPTSIVYRYRFLGVDSVWRTTSSRTVEFPKLGDGRYRFELVACNKNNGLCSSNPVSIAFTISAPIWKKPWFYVLLLVMVVCVTYAIIMLRTRNLKRTQLLLQLKVKQKTFLLQREKEAVEAIKVELENKNKDITDSINYAKRIQESILPPDELLTELFGEDHFVLFKPKDIVSGDFYWAAQLNVNNNNKEPLLLAAVIDCTGHGVPGAFLSIMANDFLRQSIIDPDVNMPNQVLDFLNEHVSSHLNQSASKNKMRDGMDIAIIGIDLNKRRLYFSGANNPIYIYRQTEGEVDQIILTATKQAIGLVTEETVKYSFREFSLLPGDTIYLFSDGYADQFGGENNKKLTYKRFRDALLAAFPLPLAEQKKLIGSRFEEWKGSVDQTDDVTVMGIRIR